MPGGKKKKKAVCFESCCFYWSSSHIQAERFDGADFKDSLWHFFSFAISPLSVVMFNICMFQHRLSESPSAVSVILDGIKSYKCCYTCPSLCIQMPTLQLLTHDASYVYIYASAFDCLHVSTRNVQPDQAACRKPASQQSANIFTLVFMYFFFLQHFSPLFIAICSLCILFFSVPSSRSPSILCSASIPAPLKSCLFLLTFSFHPSRLIFSLPFSSFISPSVSSSLSLSFLLLSPLFHSLSPPPFPLCFLSSHHSLWLALNPAAQSFFWCVFCLPLIQHRWGET